MGLYNYICPKCGWTSGSSNSYGYHTCPNCSKGRPERNIIFEDCDDITNRNKKDYEFAERDAAFQKRENTISIIVACIFLCGFLFFPGVLVLRLLDLVFHFESGWLIWLITLGSSVIVYSFCGNWKKYLILDGILIAIFLILSIFIEDLKPFSWAYDMLF